MGLARVAGRPGDVPEGPGDEVLEEEFSAEEEEVVEEEDDELT